MGAALRGNFDMLYPYGGGGGAHGDHVILCPGNKP